MGDIHVQTSIDLPDDVKDIITPQTLKYGLDLTRADPKASGFTANPQHKSEIVTLYNSAVKDGRFVRQLSTDPLEVAKQLNLPLSPGAAATLKQAASFKGSQITNFPPGFDPKVAWVTVVAVAVIVIVASKPEDEDIVMDASGLVKM